MCVSGLNSTMMKWFSSEEGEPGSGVSTLMLIFPWREWSLCNWHKVTSVSTVTHPATFQEHNPLCFWHIPELFSWSILVVRPPTRTFAIFMNMWQNQDTFHSAKCVHTFLTITNVYVPWVTIDSVLTTYIRQQLLSLIISGYLMQPLCQHFNWLRGNPVKASGLCPDRLELGRLLSSALWLHYHSSNFLWGGTSSKSSCIRNPI